MHYNLNDRAPIGEAGSLLKYYDDDDDDDDDDDYYYYNRGYTSQPR